MVAPASSDTNAAGAGLLGKRDDGKGVGPLLLLFRSTSLTLALSLLTLDRCSRGNSSPPAAPSAPEALALALAPSLDKRLRPASLGAAMRPNRSERGCTITWQDCKLVMVRGNASAFATPDDRLLLLLVLVVLVMLVLVEMEGW